MDHNKRPDFTPDPDKINIGLFHGPIQGLVTDMGFLMMVITLMSLEV